MRQIVSLSKNIYSSKQDHYSFLAQLQGHKLETNTEDAPSSNLTVDQEKKVEDYLKRLNRGHGGPK